VLDELARRLLEIGVRVPAPLRDDVVEVGELTVTVWERIVPSGAAIDWRGVGAMVERLHAVPPHELPGSYPLPSPTSLPWWDFDALLDEVGELLDDRASDAIRATVERHRGWLGMVAEDAVVCHGDVHPGNVIQSAVGPVLLDWDLLCLAPPGWDHGPMMRLAERWGGAPGEYEDFARGYGASFRGDPFAEAVADLRLVAATLMRVRLGRSDPAAAGEAASRLTYWRGDADPPMWHAQ
jgi:aminoglycoside phosphotransferase (APT) family kinase protein